MYAAGVDLTPLLYANLVRDCQRYPYHDQVAAANGVSWSLLRSWLVMGATSADEPYASFARDYLAADVELSRQVHSWLLHGRLEIELDGLRPDAIPPALASMIDDHWGPAIQQILENARSAVTITETGEASGTSARVSVKIKAPPSNALHKWAGLRWPARTGAQSVLDVVDNQHVRRLAVARAWEKPTAEERAMLEAAGWTQRSGHSAVLELGPAAGIERSQLPARKGR